MLSGGPVRNGPYGVRAEARKPVWSLWGMSPGLGVLAVVLALCCTPSPQKGPAAVGTW